VVLHVFCSHCCVTTTLNPLLSLVGRLHEQLNETADYIRMWKHALVLNPAVRDRFVWPIYCLANRLREAVLLANSTTQSANVAVEQDHLFATMPRITAEQAFVSNLAEGASLASALDSARVGGMADDFYRSPNLDQAAVPKDARYATLLAFVKHVRKHVFLHLLIAHVNVRCDQCRSGPWSVQTPSFTFAMGPCTTSSRRRQCNLFVSVRTPAMTRHLITQRATRALNTIHGQILRTVKFTTRDLGVCFKGDYD